ncbi:thiolase (plasmid) [Diaphorobacter sp. HDW4B]|uniref:thiolase n=1 Tax=Diaphorobacter sp. HDW4B TaxID=2714925 RepID=UPI0014073CC7|nr:thiolase [Diaphorobacter sp. HDW4B]QIL74159.1 thiolase [Diaphorobacter sp. HDW4B]
MNLQQLRGSVAVVGVGHAGIGDAAGFTEQEILSQAALNAIKDAGLSLKDIDGITTCSSLSTMWVMPVIEYLGIRPTFIDSTMIGGSSYVAHLLPAIHALNSGQCNAVLVCYGSTQRTATFNRSELTRVRKVMDPQPFETPYDPPMPVAAYALAAQRHAHQYGTTRKQLAEVAVAARKWAQLNPEAVMRGDLSIEDVIGARAVATPFTVRDCCMVSDGAGAFVLTRADRAKDLAKKPVYILGNATACWNRQVSSMDDLTVTAASESGNRCFDMAGYQAKDAQLAMLYDAFTINTILFLEDLGFCAKGEGGAFVDDGAIAPGGRLAVNTNGGGLSCVHPGMYGVFLVIEAVRQLRGECGARQVGNAHLAVVHGNGGTLSSQSTAMLGTADAL